LFKNDKELIDQELTENGKIDFATNFAIFLQKFPEIQRIIEAWPGLSPQARMQILDLLPKAGISEASPPADGGLFDVSQAAKELPSLDEITKEPPCPVRPPGA